MIMPTRAEFLRELCINYNFKGDLSTFLQHCYKTTSFDNVLDLLDMIEEFKKTHEYKDKKYLASNGYPKLLELISKI